MTAAGWVEAFPRVLPSRRENVVAAPAAIPDPPPHELRGIPGEYAVRL